MKLGIALPVMGKAVGNAAELRRFATRVEELGYDSLWGADRLFTPAEPVSPPPEGDYDSVLDHAGRSTDPLMIAAVAAAATSRVRFNFSTVNAPLFQPIQLARSLTTLDVLSDGRLDVGLGLSWLRDEYDAVGVPWSKRGRLYDDILSFLDAWWTSNPVEYDGEFISFPRSQVDLRPVQPGGPPIYLGGASEAALRRIGRRAAGWLTFDGLPDDLLAALWATARDAATEAGRDPSTLRMVVRVNGTPGETVAQVAKRLARAAENGADEAFVDFLFTYHTLDERLEAAEELIELAKR